jgi:hypothetical protein
MEFKDNLLVIDVNDLSQLLEERRWLARSVDFLVLLFFLQEVD